jgi:hypothetical protein
MSGVTRTAPRGVHLCGSVPLGDSDEVFRVVGEELGQHVRRIPDGETGERAGWIGWLARMFWQIDGLEARYPEQREYSPRCIGLADGWSAEDIVYPELGYAAAALHSYQRFAARKQAGDIPADVKFQVSLATPVATIACVVAEQEFAALEPGWEAAEMAELERILDGIPHAELAIQWDVCVEVWLWERSLTSPFTPVEEGVIERLARYCAAVPEDVDMGFHLCYGDYKHEHLAQPKDCRACVDIFNGAADAIGRRIDWVHLPVPIERDDDAYFVPLDELRLPAGTEFYLGLVHIRDGAEGAERRIATASRHASSFGVATECGLGRRPPERGGADDTLRQLLRIHASVAEEVR